MPTTARPRSPSGAKTPPETVRPRSQMAAFAAAVGAATGQDLRDAKALHAWTVRDFRAFWWHWAQRCGLPGPYEPVCEGDAVESARFFPAMQLNYADRLLDPSVAPADAAALTACHADGTRETWTRAALRERVATLADALARQGLAPGDRVVAVMRNDAAAVTLALAVTAVGATLSTASPDMGLQALRGRFGPLRPQWLVAHCAARPFDAGEPADAKMAALACELPDLAAVLALDGTPPRGPWQAWTLDDLAARGNAVRFDWPPLLFNHPLFILFSSGTTGRPKCIVHGAGGTLLEHLKEHRLHCDLGPADRLFFHTSCGWMMWQWQLSALASGVHLVTWDGPVDGAETLWQLVARERVTVFGTSPAYLRLSESAGLSPAREYDLGALRAILSTGAILHDRQFDWVAREVGPLPLQSISGGTDILGCFVLGHPDLPVRRGLAQCRSLGLDVQAWADGQPAQGVGELVCATPFPSRPLGFFGDADGSRFHAAYFAQNPGVWTHGDLIEFSPEGGARLHGRSDGLLNVRGIKLAPAEIVRALQDEPALREVMVVEQAGEPPRVLALVVAAQPVDDERALVSRLRQQLASRLSPAHVPDRFVFVPGLPVTHNGKPSEAAARAAVNGRPVDNLQALRDPVVLDAIREAVAPLARRLPGGPVPMPGAGGNPGAEAASLVTPLQAMWAEVIGVPDVGPDDHFLDLGGNSLHAAVIVSRLRRLAGCALPLASLLRAPTVRQLAVLAAQAGERARAAQGDAGDGLGSIGHPAPETLWSELRAGEGRPIVLVHGLSGTVMECWPLVQALRSPRPVTGLQARGLDGGTLPPARVEDIAADYVAALRRAQPVGPYALCGFSFGGLVALEMARQLRAGGERIELLCLLDPYLRRGLPAWQRAWLRARGAARRTASLDAAGWAAYLAGWWRRLAGRGVRRLRAGRGGPQAAMGRSGQQSVASLWLDPADAALIPPGLGEHQRAVFASLIASLGRYEPHPYDGAVLFVKAQEPLAGYFDPMGVWRRVLLGPLRVEMVPGGHLQLVRAQAGRLARVIDAALLPPPPDGSFDDRGRGQALEEGGEPPATEPLAPTSLRPAGGTP